MVSPLERGSNPDTYFTTLLDVNVFDPDDGEEWINIEIEWRRVSKAVPARILYDENDSPYEAAEYEIVSLKATNN